MEDPLITDDLAPNEGSVFQPTRDEELEQEISEEKAIFTGAALLREEIMRWIDSEITLCDSIDNLDLEAKTPLSAQVLAAQALKLRLQAIQSRLEAGFEQHVPR